MEKLGLIAGNRNFPLLFACAAKKSGVSIVAIAIKHDTSRKLEKLVDKIYWLGLNEFSRMFDIFKAEGITKVVMAGQVSPHRLFSKEIQQDPQLKEMLQSLKNKKTDSLFGAVAEKLAAHGITLLDSTRFIEEHLPKKGILTLKEPDASVWGDIHFGVELAKAVGLLDIGQTEAIKAKAIVAVEALEGTDNLIRRAGKIGRDGVTIVKVSKPKQDMRFDIPVIGLNTIKNLVKIKAKCLAFEATKTLFLDRQASLALANNRGLIIAAV